MNITVSNYPDQTRGLDFSQFPEAIQKGHAFLEKGGINLYSKSDSIKKTVDLYLEKLNTLAIQDKKAETRKAKVQKRSSYKAKSRVKRLVKKISASTTKKASTGSKKAQSSKLKAERKSASRKRPVKKKVSAATKKKVKTKKVVHKPLKTKPVEKPIQSRKVFSRELQILKRFANMHDKVKTIRSIELLHNLCKGVIERKQVKDHKSLVTHVKTSTGEFLTKMRAAKLDSVNVQIKSETLVKYSKTIAGAKESLRVSYLSGIDSKT
ncbi:MAG: hypothetical protein KAK04_20175, partial [Cyclobacteriaceae bacterium]|nr:hypothetical protein [Cyclobacteriaceae bacterium]